MRHMIQILAFTTLLLGTVTTAGCSSTKINDILDNFSKYEGKEVTIMGTVGETIWLAVPGTGAFQVGDGSGNIWVITNQPPPQKGVKVTITGVARSAFTLGNQALGKVIMETERR